MDVNVNDGNEKYVVARSLPPLPLRVLEVGALSTDNALNIPGITTVRRIDLRSSGPGIEEVDFMDLPVPRGSSSSSSAEQMSLGGARGARGGGYFYDVLSLSLVLNYVPDAMARGEMLKRTTLFLRRSSPPVVPVPVVPVPVGSPRLPSSSTSSPSASASPSSSSDEQQSDGNSWTDDAASVPPPPPPLLQLPCLFLVLPAPCLLNSRYLTVEHLAAMLNSLGYCLVRAKTTRKLYYSLWCYDGPGARDEWVRTGGQTVFKKREINPGGGRNNFCIVLDGDHVS
jgi:25S rRNA (adenine2142-N1)-methyltransferase